MASLSGFAFGILHITTNRSGSTKKNDDVNTTPTSLTIAIETLYVQESRQRRVEQQEERTAADNTTALLSVTPRRHITCVVLTWKHVSNITAIPVIQNMANTTGNRPHSQFQQQPLS